MNSRFVQKDTAPTKAHEGIPEIVMALGYAEAANVTAKRKTSSLFAAVQEYFAEAVRRPMNWKQASTRIDRQPLAPDGRVDLTGSDAGEAIDEATKYLQFQVGLHYGQLRTVVQKDCGIELTEVYEGSLFRTNTRKDGGKTQYLVTLTPTLRTFKSGVRSAIVAGLPLNCLPSSGHSTFYKMLNQSIKKNNGVYDSTMLDGRGRPVSDWLPSGALSEDDEPVQVAAPAAVDTSNADANKPQAGTMSARVQALSNMLESGREALAQLHDLDDEQYSELATELYNVVEKLRNAAGISESAGESQAA